MSVIATALKHLMAAGVTGDALIEAIAEIEAALPGAQPAEPPRSKAAIRQERYRRNKASQNVTNGVTSVTNHNENVTCNDERNTRGLPLPPNELISNPPTPTPEKQTARARKGSTIPDDWQPREFGPGTEARSIVDSWPPGKLKRVAEHFASHHRAKGTVSKNWHDSWSTWVHNDGKFRSSAGGHPQQNRSASTIDAVQRALELTGGAPGWDAAGSDPGDHRIGSVPDPVRAIGHVQR